MTPAEIRILLEVYTRPLEARDYGDMRNQFVHSVLSGFIAGGLVSEEFEITGKGDFYVESLCDLPLPIQKWEIPYDKMPGLMRRQTD